VIIGIVGSEAAKFTPGGEKAAKLLIRALISPPSVIEVVSGDCHLGGIDIWAQEVTEKLGKKFTAFTPAKRNWENGYRPRNLRIAHRSDEVHCITVRRLPPGFEGMTHALCYHCNTDTHVKSGGCWTMKQARREGKKGILHVIEQ
jgi:hypothetical protein